MVCYGISGVVNCETYHNTFQVPSPCFNSLLNEKQAEPNETEALRSYGNALSMQICENYT